MKKLVTLFLATGLLLTTSPILAKVATRVYQNKNLRIKITVPKAWKASRTGNTVSFSGKTAAFSLTKEKITATDRNNFKNHRLTYCQSFAASEAQQLGLSIVSVKKYTLRPNYPACQIIFSGTSEGTAIKMSQVLTVPKSRLYLYALTGITTTTLYNQAARSYFGPAFKSFKTL